MNAQDALVRLGASTAEAIAKVLESIGNDAVERGDVTVLSRDESPFAGFEGSAVAVGVAYVDGVTGGNVLLMTPAAARSLAAAMSGTPASLDAPRDELSELELSAVAEAANQMMAAAASATSVVLGQDVAIAPPQTRVFASAEEAQQAYEATPQATTTTFRIGSEPCRLVQLVPNAFVVRMTRALGELSAEQLGDGEAAAGRGALDRRALDEALRDIRVRVWAELGRTHVPLGHAPGLPPGAVVELDRKAEDPVDLYVNGLRFGSGRLVLTDEGEWALRLVEVAGTGVGARAESHDRDKEGAVT
jgi:flagellar motor switch protein FliN/FliY